MLRACLWISVLLGGGSLCCFVEPPSRQPSPSLSGGETSAGGAGSGSASGQPNPGSTTSIPPDARTGEGGGPSSSGDPPAGSTGPLDATGSGTDADGSTGEPVLPCCAPELGAGCADGSVEACVCNNDAYCCDGVWDIACVTEVEAFGCGECGMQDEIASCKALCTTFVECAPHLGYRSVAHCLEGECLGLLDQAYAEGDACVEAFAQYNACIGLLDCAAFSDYVNAQPPDGFPCKGFQDTLFAACPFATGD